MTHSAVREAVTESRTSAVVEEHLDACASCRSFATAVEHVRELAPSLTGAPPKDLADRILAGLELERGSAGGGGMAFLPSARQVWTGTVRRVTAAAAALLLVVGLAAVLRSSEDPASIVLASAERTTAEGSAAITFEADVEVVVPVRTGSAPDLTHVPTEMHAHVQRQWAQTMARFEEQLQQFQRQVDATMQDAQRHVEEAQREMQRQMEEATRRMQESWGGDPDQGSWTLPEPPPAPSMPALPEIPDVPDAPDAPNVEPPAPPTSLSTRATVRAGGTIAFGDRVMLTGRAHTQGADGSGFVIDVTGGTALYRTPDGTWSRLPGPVGPVGSLVLDAEAVGRVLSSATEVEFVGEAEGLRRYRFRADGAALGSDGGWDADAWIDREGRTRRLDLSTEASVDGTVQRTDVGMRLSSFGAPVSTGAAATASADAELPTGSSMLLYPFGPNVAASSRITSDAELDR